MSKEFYGEVTLTARIFFNAKGESLEEVKERILSTEGCILELKDEFDKDICEIDGIDWNLVDKAQQGNIAETNVSDFYIEEEQEG